MNIDLRNGDCLEVLKTLPDNSVDSIVSDPPYGLSSQPNMEEVLTKWLAGEDYTHRGGGFMGKTWDSFVPGPSIWKECFRVLKPGGHLLSFFGSRTYDIGTLAIRLAGFEIRDTVAWLYGSGFPKSLDVSKAIDKAAGVEFDAVPASGVGFMNTEGAGGYNVTKNQLVRKGERTAAARQWAGWGTALKPAMEPVCLARKPLIGTVAVNVQAYGTGAINVDGCRVETEDWDAKAMERVNSPGSGRNQGRTARQTDDGKWDGPIGTGAMDTSKGRWPANVIHDGSKEPVGLLGDAARFYYCAKASKRDRGRGNSHPTVKPTDLMRYLVRLVTPPGGVVLDPFMGSGSTGKAAKIEGFAFIGIEMSSEYFEIAKARIDKTNVKDEDPRKSTYVSEPINDDLFLFKDK